MLKRPLRWLVRLYQRVLAPMLPPACRFYPSCSNYALEALDRLPVYKAVPLILWRIARCQPLCKGGYDPVPGSDQTDAHCPTHHK